MSALPAPKPDPAAGLSGAQKCAILLLVLEEAQAAEMLAGMTPAEVQQVGEAMLTVAEIAPEAFDAVLDEFLARTAQVTALDSQGRQVRQRGQQLAPVLLPSCRSPPGQRKPRRSAPPFGAGYVSSGRSLRVLVRGLGQG
jgi:hypothetical protein